MTLKRVITSHIIEEKRISRFKKWYYMSFLKEFNNKNDKKESFDSTPTKKINTENVFSPKLSISIKNFGSIHMISEKNLTKSMSAVLKKNNPIEKNNTLDEFDSNYSINQAEIGMRKFFMENRETFRSRLIKGPPDCFRWISWILAADIPDNRNEVLFQNLFNQEIDKKTDSQIKKDLNRTLSEDHFFIINHIFFAN